MNSTNMQELEAMKKEIEEAFADVECTTEQSGVNEIETKPRSSIGSVSKYTQSIKSQKSSDRFDTGVKSIHEDLTDNVEHFGEDMKPRGLKLRHKNSDREVPQKFKPSRNINPSNDATDNSLEDKQPTENSRRIKSRVQSANTKESKHSTPNIGNNTNVDINNSNSANSKSKQGSRSLQQTVKGKQRKKRPVKRRFYHRIDPFSVIVTVIVMSILQIAIVYFCIMYMGGVGYVN